MATKKKEVKKDAAVKKVEPAKKVEPKKEAVKTVAEKKEAVKAKATTEPVKKVEAENPPVVAEKTETKVKFEPKKHDDFCTEVEAAFLTGTFGLYDPNNKTCQDCETEYAGAFEACKHNTEGQAKLKAETAATKPVKVKKEPGAKKESAGTNEFGHKLNSGTAALDAALIAGATMEELKAIRGAISSHFAHLTKEHGVFIDKKDGKYIIVTEKPVKATKVEPEVKAETKPEVKAEAKKETKPAAKVEPKGKKK